MPTFAPVIKNDGAIAQLVEQRTENPCVPGSIPGGTTSKKSHWFNESVTLFLSIQLIRQPVTADGISVRSNG